MHEQHALKNNTNFNRSTINNNNSCNSAHGQSVNLEIKIQNSRENRVIKSLKRTQEFLENEDKTFDFSKTCSKPNTNEKY